MRFTFPLTKIPYTESACIPFCAVMISPHTVAMLPVIPISVEGITFHPIAKANTLEINLNFSLSITLPSSNPSEILIVFHHITLEARRFMPPSHPQCSFKSISQVMTFPCL